MGLPRLTKRQRELLLEAVERGAVDWHRGSRGTPIFALKALGLIEHGSRPSSFHSHRSVAEPTDEGRRVAAALKAQR